MGKTVLKAYSVRQVQKHPHERGEDALANLPSVTDVETPPRAWGRLGAVEADPSTVRNTPTSVGKTQQSHTKAATNGKHPHERGEDDSG